MLNREVQLIKDLKSEDKYSARDYETKTLLPILYAPCLVFLRIIWGPPQI